MTLEVDKITVRKGDIFYLIVFKIYINGIYSKWNAVITHNVLIYISLKWNKRLLNFGWPWDTQEQNVKCTHFNHSS